ncbi:Glycosyl phosphatidyl inositol protein transamidase complex subunit [Tieghemiomyces parasiticus]|uniref:Glycosyl phosphatidyl inositol protein transamidase complex subunit n=1 Tax=Tieghemiomyces parasiticus TaxID=78921 RepID=A0A9W8DVD2_9FUNG|nr:Glycosyl phosphatidyl inositol protein transamidase complex subunit [Tieghemiomyces parasiticus]
MTDSVAAGRLIKRTQRLQRAIQFVHSHIRLLSRVLLALGFLWLVAFPSTFYSRNTYLSENALLPNQAHLHYWDDEARTAGVHRDRLAAFETDRAGQVAHVLDTLNTRGYHAETQRFTYADRFAGRVLNGTNVHGVLYAPRGDTTEALVLSASWRSADNSTDNSSGIALVLSLAEYFATTSHWSKDIIVLITDQGDVGAELWLRSYHGEDHPAAQPLTVRSGAIQAALHLELPPAPDYDTVGVFFEGKNGQLPNLDLINILARIARHNQVPFTLHHLDRATPALLSARDRDITDLAQWPLLWAHYQESMRTLVATMAVSALGLTGGPHATFHRYRIDAVTLRARAATSGDGPRIHFMSLGRVIESTFRSLSNLLEHFHQSFFIYLLASPWQYISIADFIPPVLILAAGLLASALESWWDAAAYYRVPATAIKDTLQQVRHQFPRRQFDHLTFWLHAPEVGVVLAVYFLGAGGTLLALPALLNLLVPLASSGDARIHLLVGTGSVVVITAFWYGLVQRGVRCDTRLLRVVTLLVTMLTITAVSTINFSLALLYALLTAVPFALLPVGHPPLLATAADLRLRREVDAPVGSWSAAPSSSAASGASLPGRLVLTAYLAFVSPPGLLWLISQATAVPWERLVHFLMIENDLFGSWLYPLLGGVYVPSILAALTVLWG